MTLHLTEATTRYPDFAGLLAGAEDDGMTLRLRRAETIGRPWAGKTSSRGSKRERQNPARGQARPETAIKCAAAVKRQILRQVMV